LPPPPPVPLQLISLPIEQQNFWDNNDAPITAPITNSNKVHDLNKFPLDEDLYI
jgi:hypothetical protein